ncbi:hypothetical protein FQU23_013490 [Flavobacterium sp. XN-5]|uniref:hypothetical protein n=1 Tax=Flavobacterium sp. XN-5 TaxID=2599390 RepID=UPI0011CB6B73|nr:hypothetical protein [Flavobacterium sp. XN-5]NGY38519.1 hypothetical protein [Flavobacterium sp. XN-5]
MRKITCLILVLFSIISCSSESSSTKNNSIIGKWNWVESSGGIDGRTETPKSTGKTIQLEISNSKIKKYVDEALVSETAYTIQTGTSIFGGEKKLIVYENDWKQSFSRADNQLFLNDECYDCFQNKYVKE